MVLEAPHPEYAPETKSPARPRTTMREFTEFDDDGHDEATAPARRSGGVRVRVRGGLPKSWAGRLAVVTGIVLLLGLVTGGAMVVRSAVLHDERFFIPSSSAIEILGNSHITRAQLLSIFGEDIERNIFRVSLADRQQQLEQLPWVEHATVMRLLPNRLRVSIIERTPIAFARQGNHIGLVDASGVLLNMPTDIQANMHYSFPVITGLAQNDPQSLRTARMKLYARFTQDLDSSGEKISQKLSEVDLADPEDVRAVIPDKAGEVMVHFGEDNFLDRYRKFEEHLPEWRTQYPHLASVDMRYDRQVVLEMQQAAAPPQQTVPDTASNVDAPAPHTASPIKPKPASTAQKKTPPKPSVKTQPKKPTTTAKGVPSHINNGTDATPHPVQVSNQAFWVHPPKKGTAAAGEDSGTEVKYHPPQVVHP